jgi:hypothetical protein
MNQKPVPIRSNHAFHELALGSTPVSSSPAAESWSDTLHYTNYVLGEAVQFNSSVSAMPAQHLENSHAPVPGTADTLL